MFTEYIKTTYPDPIYIFQEISTSKRDKLQNMYWQQSLITLDQLYEWKPLSKLEAFASLIIRFLRNILSMILTEEDQKAIPKSSYLTLSLPCSL